MNPLISGQARGPSSLFPLSALRSPVSESPRLKIVFVGHVDHGKSTLIGRILAETNSLTEGKVESIRQSCAAQGQPFEYAFLLDALSEEQEQNITIDTTQVQFASGRRSYVIIDAPGHLEFLKNMITGAASADAAIMVIAAAGFFTHVAGLLYSAVFLMGLHSTLFGPVKYAYLPQHLSSAELTGGNGLVEMGTFVAILLGTMAGGILAGDLGAQYVAWACVAMAVLGRVAGKRVTYKKLTGRDRLPGAGQAGQ